MTLRDLHYYAEEAPGTERGAHRNMLCHDHVQIHNANSF